MSRAIALFEFEGTEDNELGFEKGAEIVITQTYDDSDWTAGYLSNDPNKTEGLFPTNYVEIQQEESNKIIKQENDQKNEISKTNNILQESQSKSKNKNGKEKENENEKEEEEENEKEKEKEKEYENENENENENEKEKGKHEENEKKKKNKKDLSISKESQNVVHTSKKTKSSKKIKKIYELQNDFVWKPNGDQIKTSIIEVTEKGIFSKTQFFKVQAEYSNVTNVVTFSWEDIRWLRSMYERHYPNVCISPLIDLKPAEREPFKTLSGCRKFTSEHFLNRITEHPILSQSEILRGLFSSTDSKSFSKKKKEIEKKTQHFWKLVHHNFPVPDTKLSQQIDLFRKNLASHAIAVNELYRIQKEVSLNQYLELHNSYFLLARSFFNWSKIPFDWRLEIPENAKKMNNSIRRAVKEIARSYKDAANKYHEQSNSEMNLLELFFLEYEQFSSCFKQPFKHRDQSQIKYHEAEQSQLSLEKKSSGSEKDNERLEKARKLVSETKDKADTITYINLVEGEYFRKMRAKDTKEKLSAYTDLQIKLYQDLTQIFTKAKNMIQKIDLDN
ncbi:sorting nexin [Anaeramoeba flamelloides]|uniref:Sorting nexin n=1 Tax=Anaeramoeba flamelloides TaxID=1746091 RepID=A0AAV7YWR0_9EUKA|nr:sorting nexin [Anaeramoeba flamelloides]